MALLQCARLSVCTGVACPWARPLRLGALIVGTACCSDAAVQLRQMVMLVKRVAGREEGKALVAEGEHTATAAELNEKGGEPTKKGRGGKQSQAPADRK